MIEGCDGKVKRTRLVRIVNWLCGALLIGITVWVACHYAALPDNIPTHFGADGVIDGYGGKSMIWGMLAIMWVLVIVMSVTDLFPRHWNVPSSYLWRVCLHAWLLRVCEEKTCWRGSSRWC